MFLFYIVMTLYFLRPAFLLSLPLMVLVLPSATRILHFAVLHERKQLADVLAAKIIRDPQSMVDAMRRIEMSEGRVAHLLPSLILPLVPWALPGYEGRDIVTCTRWPGRASRPSRRVTHLASLDGGAVDVERPLRPSRGAG